MSFILFYFILFSLNFCVWAPTSVVSLPLSSAAATLNIERLVAVASSRSTGQCLSREAPPLLQPHLTYFPIPGPAVGPIAGSLFYISSQASPLRPDSIVPHQHIPIPTIMPSMARFGRVKKTLKPEPENANSDALASPTSDTPRRSPRVSLPHVETQLNMHRYNGLFEPESPERQKESAMMDASAGWWTPFLSFFFGSPN